MGILDKVRSRARGSHVRKLIKTKFTGDAGRSTQMWALWLSRGHRERPHDTTGTDDGSRRL